MKTQFLAQSPSPSPPPLPSQSQQPFDPGTATIWAALITAGLSSIATIISLISNRRLMTRLERERREHDVQMAHMTQEHKIQIENARLRPERRLQFIGYWRKLIRNANLTYKDIIEDKAYRTLEGFMSSDILQRIQQELQKTETEKKQLHDRLEFEKTVFYAPSIIWDDDVYDRGEHKKYEKLYDEWYSHLDHDDFKEIEKGFQKGKKRLEQFDIDLTQFIRKQLEEELRRLEEEWELL